MFYGEIIKIVRGKILKMKYDLVVVGAGPGGSIAALSAREKGLNVAIVERRKIGDILMRANTCMMVDSEGFNGEHLKISEENGSSKIIFRKNGFEVTYPGQLEKIYDSVSFSPAGKKVHVHNTKFPLYHLFDNQLMLDSLSSEAEEAGVKIFDETLAVDASDDGNGVKIKVKSSSGDDTIEGKMVIIGEGLKSAIAKKVGANKQRQVMGRGPSLAYTLDNVNFPFKNRGFCTFYGSTYSRGGGVLYMAPCSGNDKRFYVGISGVNPSKFCRIFLEEFFEKEMLKEWFKDANVISRNGAVVHLITPMPDPVNGNIFFIGDSAGFAETMYQGAMMCGYRAANAVAMELDGKNGRGDYREFWRNSFRWIKNPQAMADYLKIGFFYPFFSDKELDYLFGLVDGQTFEGVHDPYRAVNNLFDIILQSKDIDSATSEKAKKFQKITMQDIAQLIVQKRQFAKKE